MSTPRRVFISRVSREFGPVAEDLRNTLQAVEHAARTQFSFRQEAETDTTLSKLSLYIHDSDIVLALTGILSGGYPSDESLNDNIQPDPPVGSKEKTWRDLLPAGLTILSYTQWEIILARFWNKSLYLYFRSDGYAEPYETTGDDDLPQQQQFIGWLTKTISLDRAYFSSGHHLEKLVLRDLWPRRLRTALRALAALAFLFIQWLSTRNITGAVAESDNKAAARAGDLSLQLDEIKPPSPTRAATSRASPQSEREQLLAIRSGQTVAQLRANLAEAQKSHAPYTRAAALVIAGHPDEALAERQAVASLLDKEKAPLAWADAQFWVAWSLDDLKDGRAAEAILREVVSLRQRVLGPEHPPDTLTSRYNLALALAHQEKWREARVVAEVAEAGFRWVLGDGHPPLIRWMRSGWWSY